MSSRLASKSRQPSWLYRPITSTATNLHRQVQMTLRGRAESLGSRTRASIACLHARTSPSCFPLSYCPHLLTKAASRDTRHQKDCRQLGGRAVRLLASPNHSSSSRGWSSSRMASNISWPSQTCCLVRKPSSRSPQTPSMPWSQSIQYISQTSPRPWALPSTSPPPIRLRNWVKSLGRQGPSWAATSVLPARSSFRASSWVTAWMYSSACGLEAAGRLWASCRVLSSSGMEKEGSSTISLSRSSLLSTQSRCMSAPSPPPSHRQSMSQQPQASRAWASQPPSPASRSTLVQSMMISRASISMSLSRRGRLVLCSRSMRVRIMCRHRHFSCRARPWGCTCLFLSTASRQGLLDRSQMDSMRREYTSMSTQAGLRDTRDCSSFLASSPSLVLLLTDACSSWKHWMVCFISYNVIVNVNQYWCKAARFTIVIRVIKPPINQILHNRMQGKQQRGRPKQGEVAPPRLLYYNIRGLGQSIRNLLSYLDVDYENVIISRGDESAKKYEATFGLFDSGLPIFEDECVSVSNCIAIGVYVCARWGARLLGHDLTTRAKINEVLYKYSLEMNKIMPFIIETVVKSSSLQGNSKTLYLQETLKRLARECRFLSYCLARHKATKSWIGGSELSILDFHFYEPCFYLCGFFRPVIEGCEELTGFATFLARFESLGLGKGKGQAQVGVFLEFKNEKMREAVRKSWLGDQHMLLV